MTPPFTDDEIRAVIYEAFADMGFANPDDRVTEEQVNEAERRAMEKLRLRVVEQMARHPHHCHWPGCTAEVPPKLWGCRSHWYMLPKKLRDKIWMYYVSGQETTKTPSREYIQVAEEVQSWIRQNHPTST